MSNFLARLMPFVLLGIAIVILAFGVILLTYLLIFGVLVGMVLFLVSWLKTKLFPSKQLKSKQSQTGRIIDHQK